MTRTPNRDYALPPDGFEPGSEAMDQAKELSYSHQIFTRMATRKGIDDCLTVDEPTVNAQTGQKDRDDGFWVEYDQNEKIYYLRVYLPNLGEVITPDSPLDLAARARWQTEYFGYPGGKKGELSAIPTNFPMLPWSLSEGIYSLNEGRVVPTLCFVFEFDALTMNDSDLTAEACYCAEIEYAAVKARTNLKYAEANAELAAGTATPNGRMLDHAKKIAERLYKERTAARDPLLAAIMAQLPPKAQKSFPKPYDQNPTTPAEMIVREFMILVNHYAATFLQQKKVAALYRNAALNLMNNRTQLHRIEWGGTTIDSETLKRVKQVQWFVGDQNQNDGNLVAGHSAYTPVTAGLRRYTDLVNLQQIAALMSNAEGGSLTVRTRKQLGQILAQKPRSPRRLPR
ncbi:RNB domain-containing ribonuclease [Candidatus Peregrinibacteria bacterium]|nr:MAG: RNB domain-containing ribonuclease [Candidatus Peregrinibacteria bacterium]